MSQTAVSPETAAIPVNPSNWDGVSAAQAAVSQTQFISFAIGDDQYGVDIMAVRETSCPASSPMTAS